MASSAQDEAGAEHAGRGVRWRIAMQPGKRRKLEVGREAWREEKEKASVRAKVEHVFWWVKVGFGYRKVRYRGIRKNMERLYVLLGFANLMRSQRLVCAG